MSEGDLLTTPNWTWHDHFNGGDEPIVWLDGLDIRLVGTFGAMIQENFKKEQQPIEKPDHYSRRFSAKRARRGLRVNSPRRPIDSLA